MTGTRSVHGESPARRVVLVRPDAPAHAGSTQTLSPGLAGLRAATLGVLDNSKANADVLLAYLVETLRSRHALAATVVRRKQYPTNPAPARLIEELARKSDCVVTAIGD